MLLPLPIIALIRKCVEFNKNHFVIKILVIMTTNSSCSHHLHKPLNALGIFGVLVALGEPAGAAWCTWSAGSAIFTRVLGVRNDLGVIVRRALGVP